MNQLTSMLTNSDFHFIFRPFPANSFVHVAPTTHVIDQPVSGTHNLLTGQNSSTESLRIRITPEPSSHCRLTSEALDSLLFGEHIYSTSKCNQTKPVHVLPIRLC